MEHAMNMGPVEERSDFDVSYHRPELGSNAVERLPNQGAKISCFTGRSPKLNSNRCRGETSSTRLIKEKAYKLSNGSDLLSPSPLASLNASLVHWSPFRAMSLKMPLCVILHQARIGLSLRLPPNPGRS